MVIFSFGKFAVSEREKDPAANVLTQRALNWLAISTHYLAFVVLVAICMSWKQISKQY